MKKQKIQTTGRVFFLLIILVKNKCWSVSLSAQLFKKNNDGLSCTYVVCKEQYESCWCFLFLYIHSEYRSGKFTSGWDVFIVVLYSLRKQMKTRAGRKAGFSEKKLFPKNM